MTQTIPLKIPQDAPLQAVLTVSRLIIIVSQLFGTVAKLDYQLIRALANPINMFEHTKNHNTLIRLQSIDGECNPTLARKKGNSDQLIIYFTVLYY